jgi:hypothetical protein
MATAIDYKLTDDGDLYISSTGDFERTESDQQASILILNTNQGSWKFAPFCGVGINQYKGSSGTNLVMKREITVQHQADGFKVNSIIVKDYSDFYLDIERVNNND